jgi:hypothetical protein
MFANEEISSDEMKKQVIAIDREKVAEIKKLQSQLKKMKQAQTIAATRTQAL